MVVYLSVDKQMFHTANDSASAAQVQLELRTKRYLEALRREYPPTHIPYVQSLDLLSATVSSERFKAQLQSRLDLERERSKNLEILLNTFQKKLEASNSKTSELHVQLKALKEMNGSLQDELASKNNLILQLELQCNKQMFQSGPASPPNVTLGPKGAANGSNHKLDNAAGVPAFEDEGLPLSSLLPNPKSCFETIDQDANHHHPTNQGPYLEKSVMNQYNAKLVELTDQVEMADSQAKRFHDAWCEALDHVSESQAERDALKRQVELLTEELAKTKEEALSLESNYKQQINYLTEKYAELMQGRTA